MPKQALQVELYDYDAMDSDDLIGEAKFDVKEMGDQEEKDLWLDIQPVKPEKGSHKACDTRHRALLLPASAMHCARPHI